MISRIVVTSSSQGDEESAERAAEQAEAERDEPGDHPHLHRVHAHPLQHPQGLPRSPRCLPSRWVDCSAPVHLAT